MATALSMAAAAFVLTLGLGYPVLAYLRRAGIEKQVSVDELPSHFSKTGTPTMGGLLFVGPIAVLMLALAMTWLHDSGRSILVPTGTMLLTATLGAYDDRLSLVGSRGGGMRARVKFVLLGLAALVAALALWHSEVLGIDYLFVPGISERIEIGWLIVPWPGWLLSARRTPSISPTGSTGWLATPPRWRSRRTARSRSCRVRCTWSRSASRWQARCSPSCGSTPTRPR